MRSQPKSLPKSRKNKNWNENKNGVGMKTSISWSSFDSHAWPTPLLPVGRIHTANIMQAFAENGSKGSGGGGGESYKTSWTDTRYLGSPNYFNDHYKLKKNKGLKNLFLNANEYGNNLRSTSHFQLVTKLLSWTLQINHLYNIIYGRP